MNRLTPIHACLAPDADRSCAPAIPPGIEAIIFDFDGTLADTTDSHERALQKALLRYGVDLDPGWYRRHVGLSIDDLLAALPGAAGLPHREVIAHSRAELLSTLPLIKPIGCVLAFLRTARRAGVPCAVASGASRVLVEPGLDALDLREEFTAVITREDVAQGKPAPDLYVAAATCLGVAPECCLGVDDAADGLTAATRAGMPVLPVVDGHLTAAQLPRQTPTTVIRAGRVQAPPPDNASAPADAVRSTMSTLDHTGERDARSALD
jgi:HAD superfamily hydrolase (TIGR01509 family)